MPIEILVLTSETQTPIIKLLQEKGYRTVKMKDLRGTLTIIPDVIVSIQSPLGVIDSLNHCQSSSLLKRIPFLFIDHSLDSIPYSLLLSKGASDCVQANMSVQEHLYRIELLLKQTQPLSGNALSNQTMVIHESKRELMFDGRQISFSKKEFAIFSALKKRSGHPISREALFQIAWSSNSDSQIRAVDTTIKKIRKKLIDTPITIKTERGLGYYYHEKQKDD